MAGHLRPAFNLSKMQTTLKPYQQTALLPVEQLPAVPDVKPEQVAYIAKCRANAIRLHEPAQQVIQVLSALMACNAYFATPDKQAAKEFTEIFAESYPNLAAEEIRAALRLNAAGKFGEESAKNRVFYNNLFNVSIMCAILNEYQEWRKSVVAALVIAEDEERRESERLKQKAAWIESLAVEKAAFLRGEYGELNSWQDVPVYWFEWAEQAGKIEWEKGEKRKRYDASLIEAENELKAQNENTRLSGRMNEILKGQQLTNSIESRARVIRQKRVVWEKIVRK